MTDRLANPLTDLNCKNEWGCLPMLEFGIWELGRSSSLWKNNRSRVASSIGRCSRRNVFPDLKSWCCRVGGHRCNGLLWVTRDSAQFATLSRAGAVAWLSARGLFALKDYEIRRHRVSVSAGTFRRRRRRTGDGTCSISQTRINAIASDRIRIETRLGRFGREEHLIQRRTLLQNRLACRGAGSISR